MVDPKKKIIYEFLRNEKVGVGLFGMVSLLQKQAIQKKQELMEGREDMVDYYTKWAHQIKTPLSVMKLSIREKDTPENRLLLSQLFLVEQYVEMVLQYIRLDSETNDLMIQEYSLNNLMRECIRKFAPVFISRKISLDYWPMEGTVVTDRKYFLYLAKEAAERISVEIQVVSNPGEGSIFRLRFQERIEMFD